MTLMWRCPRHGVVPLQQCRNSDCGFHPLAIADPAGYYPGQVWDDVEGDVGVCLDWETVQRLKDSHA